MQLFFSNILLQIAIPSLWRYPVENQRKWLLVHVNTFKWKNWRPPRLRAFGSGGRKRNTYEYACLLTRPDCRRTKKKFWLNEFSSFTGRKSGILISIIHEFSWRNLRNKKWHNLKFHLKIFENELLKTKIKILQEIWKNDKSLAL